MRFRSSYPLVISMCLIFATSPAPSQAAAPWQGFDDVPPSNAFYGDISWLHDEGITKGCNPPSNTLFCPEEAVTRGEMAAFLNRALELPLPATGDWFEDDDNSVFENDIDRIAAAGITRGCNPPANTEFCPEQPVTRAEMATFLVRALGLIDGADLDWFRDVAHSVHSANINRLRAAGITFGCNPPFENQFCPELPVTREEMAAFLHRGLTQPTVGAALAIHGSVWPEPVYLYGDMVATLQVRNEGTVPFVDVVGGAAESEYDPSGGCVTGSFTGPVEYLGNDDSEFDPGEIWDWYCGQYAYDWSGLIRFEATATTAGNETVRALEELEYSAIDPIYTTVTASATAVEPGDKVTWIVVLHNPSQVTCVDVLIQVRENGWGSYTDYRSPDLILVGDDDADFEPGEQWQYEYSAAVWSDTYVEVAGGYAPDFSPGTGTGIEYLFSDTVVVEP